MSKDEHFHPKEDKWKKIAEEEMKAAAQALEQDAESEPAPTNVAPGALEQLRAELIQEQKKAQENFDKALRLQAEMQNMQIRTRKEVENAHRYSLEKFVKELIPVIDSLERSLANQDATRASDPVLVGVNMTLAMMLKVVGSFGVTQFDPLGQVFDPNRHEAVGMQPKADAPDDTVLAVLHKGYVLQDRVVCPAKVVVVKN